MNDSEFYENDNGLNASDLIKPSINVNLDETDQDADSTI